MNLITRILLVLLVALCSHAQTVKKNRVWWTVETRQYAGMPFVYTPFFVSKAQDSITFFSAGGGIYGGNGINKHISNIKGTAGFQNFSLIPTGPHPTELNYFRGLRIARSGAEYWMITEVAKCYWQCGADGSERRLAVYQSNDNGNNWSYKGFLKVDKKEVVGEWSAHTGLIFNPDGDKQINKSDLTKNRFITVADANKLFVSANGVDYESVPIKNPFNQDQFVFASIAYTPKGYHIMAGAQWTEAAGVTTVRHLFSKDLVNWHSMQDQSYLKNKHFYKGVHLSYESEANRLWAFSPCGSEKDCGVLAWLEPQDYLE